MNNGNKIKVHPDIKMLGEDILKNDSTDVVAITEEDLELINKMYRVMEEANGLGLAANQVGSPLSIFVTKMRGKPEVFINPEIVEASEPTMFEEGCLSIPGVAEQTRRFNRIKLTFQTPEDMQYTLIEEFEGLNAIVIQHEVDHLSGKLFIDNMSRQVRRIAAKRVKKILSDNRRKS